MTGIVVTTEACYAELEWTGVEESFVPGFRALADADVHVYSRDADGVVTELTNPAHFTVSRDSAGAVTVTPVSLPTAPKDILIERITPATQTVSFNDLESFPGEIYTRLFTAAAMRAAELRRKITLQQASIEDLVALEEDLQAAVTAAAGSASAAGDALEVLQELITETTILYFANGVPSNDFGKDGDVYVQKDSATWLLYGPKAAGSWGASVGELKPVAGNVSQASNATEANRMMRSGGADKSIKETSISVADDGTITGARFNTPAQSYEAATKAYADGLFATNDALLFKGLIDCSTNPNYPAADAGHAYKVNVAGKIGGGSGLNVEAGDWLFCHVDSSASGNHATVGANWGILQHNVDAPLKNADIGSTVQAYDAQTTKNNVEDQTLTGGARVTLKDLGNLSGNTITPDPGDRPMQKITNNGAGTIAPGTNVGSYILYVENTTGAAVPTTSGWLKKDGDAFTTVTTDKFLCSCIVVASGVSSMSVKKLT